MLELCKYILLKLYQFVFIIVSNCVVPCWASHNNSQLQEILSPMRNQSPTVPTVRGWRKQATNSLGIIFASLGFCFALWWLCFIKQRCKVRPNCLDAAENPIWLLIGRAPARWPMREGPQFVSGPMGGVQIFGYSFHCLCWDAGVGPVAGGLGCIPELRYWTHQFDNNHHLIWNNSTL